MRRMDVRNRRERQMPAYSLCWRDPPRGGARSVGGGQRVRAAGYERGGRGVVLRRGRGGAARTRRRGWWQVRPQHKCTAALPARPCGRGRGGLTECAGAACARMDSAETDWTETNRTTAPGCIAIGCGRVRRQRGVRWRGAEATMWWPPGTRAAWPSDRQRVHTETQGVIRAFCQGRFLERAPVGPRHNGQAAARTAHMDLS